MSENPHTLHFISLLNTAAGMVVDDLHERLTARGLTDIRGAHGCVFGNIGPEGARLTDLAERARLTKQAVGEVVQELEQLGYVERRPDPNDGRAKIITLTERGREAQQAGFEEVEQIEAEWAERLGAERVEAMRETLAELLGVELPARA